MKAPYSRYLKLLLILQLVLALFPLGCGTVSIDLYTKVKPTGDVRQQVQISGTGMMGNLVVSSDIIQEFKKDGWEVTTSHSEGSASLIATKDFEEGEEIAIPGFGEDSSEISFQDAVFYEKDRLVYKEYYFEVTIPGTAIGLEEQDEFAELGKAMMKSVFNMSWTLDLPGRIVETNADVHDDESATWYFDVESVETGRYMMVHTRYINWVAIGIIAGVILIGVVLFLVIRRRAAA
ncbi:MAG TPA: hypothetical protein G4O01_08455 [Dehalococcoidia bacterium]|jgi:hypothetical protein|nr:hypothetical protein [Dehalococcoidia bacterium]